MISMLNYLEQQVIRTVLALCMFAVRCQGSEVRDDMRDEAVALTHLWLRVVSSNANGHDPADHLRQWCFQILPRLEALSRESGQPLDAVLAVQAAVLRLRTSLGAPQPAQPPVKSARPARSPAPTRNNSSTGVLGSNAKRVLGFVREHPDVRPKELISHFSGTLSDRTVKRCLKDLIEAKAIVRIEQDGAVQYRIDSESAFAI